MDKSYHYIRRLYLEKLTDTISREDDALLQELLHNHNEARMIWERLEEERKTLNADIVLTRIDPESELEAWNKRIDDRKKMPLSAGWWRWAAAAVILIAIGVSYFFRDNPARSNVPADPAVTGNPGAGETHPIRLLLADGNSVAFSENGTEAYTIGGIRLKNSGNQLTYGGNNLQAGTLHTLEVPATRNYGITLSDGTRVFLNSKSKLRFPFYFTAAARSVYIEGEAYLEVAKDTGKPFIVYTPSAEVRVTGTRFNVNTYKEGSTRASLVEGKVFLRADEKSLELHPGREATYTKNKGFTTNAFDADELLSWRTGVFYFQRQQLGELTSLIYRWFGIHVVFEREQLARHAVSGMIEKDRLAEFLKDLHVTSGINYTLKDTTLYLR